MVLMLSIKKKVKFLLFTLARHIIVGHSFSRHASIHPLYSICGSFPYSYFIRKIKTGISWQNRPKWQHSEPQHQQHETQYQQHETQCQHRETQHQQHETQYKQHEIQYQQHEIHHQQHEIQYQQHVYNHRKEKQRQKEQYGQMLSLGSI